MNPLCLQSASSLAAGIRSGELRSEDVVRAHIHRLQVVNPTLNLVVRDRFEAALSEARAADSRLAMEGPDGLPPFHGVPCSIKESFALEGMPNTAGLVSRAGHIATRDATAVARLRAAGAIPLGVTNVSELCMWMESHNKLYGRSRNPYDPGRIVGGSSGGEAGVVGAGGAPFGLGSDIGGSIRMPAFFNGVFGHKPTGGLVPGTGQFPGGSGEQLRYVTTGPICRRAEDLWPLLRAMAGPDGEDPGCREVALGDPSGVALEDLTVLDVPDNGMTPLHPSLRAAQERVVAHLASRGARVVRARIPALRDSLFIWSSMLSAAGGPSYAELLADGGSFHLGRELIRSLWGGSPFTLPSLGLALLELVPKLLPKGADKFIAKGEALKAELVDRIGPRGVMLYPSYAEPAPRHRMPLLPPTRWAYTCILNVMELPSTQVPLGLDGRGLPLGVQVVGIHDNDHVTVAVALALEKAFGGWVPPPR
ncbi:MAG: amidase [Polyangia bacterium]|nr:amidase [Polyangia bacterium]